MKSQRENKHPDHFALIIGTMKGGTTSLFEILSQHPQICSSKVKEPDYFTKDRNDDEQKSYLSLWNWKKKSHHVALESSVAYTKAPLIRGVPQRIYNSNLGQYRLIYMLRDPLARIESQVRHGLFAGWGESLDTGMSDDLIVFSSYAKQLDYYLEYFSRDDIFIVTLEEFQYQPHDVLEKICKYLEVDSQFQFTRVKEPRNSGEFFNASQGVAKVTQGQISQFLAQKVLPSGIKSWIRSCIAKLNKNKSSNSNMERWQLKPEERIIVLHRLAEDLKKLESIYQVDVRRYWHIPVEFLD